MARGTTKPDRKALLDHQTLTRIAYVEKWSVEYDWLNDTFVLTVYWGQNGAYCKRVIPSSSVNAVVEIFDSAERTGGKVKFDAREGQRKLYLN
ncbi:MAG: hypothetical protein H8E66_33965 [Planctomycetes bacterium]|nr:hypothetical protein [Planctomycetota bacterium]